MVVATYPFSATHGTERYYFNLHKHTLISLIDTVHKLHHNSKSMFSIGFPYKDIHDVVNKVLLGYSVKLHKQGLEY